MEESVINLTYEEIKEILFALTTELITNLCDKNKRIEINDLIQKILLLNPKQEKVYILQKFGL